MKTLWVFAVFCAAAAWAGQSSYSNTSGTVSQMFDIHTTSTVTITGSTLGSPAGTVTMTCTRAAAAVFRCSRMTAPPL